MEIDFSAGDVSGNDTDNSTVENNGNLVINNGNKQTGNGLRRGGNERTGDGKDLTGNDLGLETVNEYITLDSCISLGNSGAGSADSAQNGKSEYGQIGTAARKGGISAEQHKVTVRNEDSDSEAGDDDRESVYSIDLGSNITLGDETAKSADFTEWDSSKIAGENNFEPAATSTQYVNAITKIGGEKAKLKVDNKQRVIPKNYTQATTGELGEIWRLAIEKEMNAMAEPMGHRGKAKGLQTVTMRMEILV